MMQFIICLIRRMFLVLILILTGAILLILGDEIYIYVTRSEAKAKAEAIELFHCICKRQGYREADFEGPRRVVNEGEGNAYDFQWSVRKAPNLKFDIIAYYLPAYFDYTASPSFEKFIHIEKTKPMQPSCD